MFGSQTAYPEKLLHKKESLQNQLINIRVELSQATTVSWHLGLCVHCLPVLLLYPTFFSESKSRVLPPGRCRGKELDIFLMVDSKHVNLLIPNSPPQEMSFLPMNWLYQGQREVGDSFPWLL